MVKRFSQRYGYVKVEDVFQLNDLNEETRKAIWNYLYLGLFSNRGLQDRPTRCAQSIWIHYFNNPADNIPAYDRDFTYENSLLTTIKKYIYEAKWFNVLDLLEELLDYTSDFYQFDLGEYINAVFEKYGAGYRVIDGLITPISDEVEIESIEGALANNTESARNHFTRALELMADREQPDYRNSIKESISAIESLCKKISGNEKGTLGDCLKTIEDKGHIHPAMKRAFQQLYGYTSDQGGIRHALTDDSEEPTLEEARYMLVICSAFSNYLVSKMAD
ncbi:AbiJ-NTD4 domain-containing protein [Klebsiella pneumoniae]